MTPGADDRVEAASQATKQAGTRFGWGSAEYGLAREAELRIEREVAAEAGNEWAEEIVISPLWDSGAPRPFVLASEHEVIVAYYVAASDPASLASNGSTDPIGVLTFRGGNHRFGGPNDEVLHAHPLAGRGLNSYGAHLVHNSRWIEELRTINSVHHRFDPGSWTKLGHYFLAFHDTVFECLAVGYESEVVHASMYDVVVGLASNLATRFH